MSPTRTSFSAKLLSFVFRYLIKPTSSFVDSKSWQHYLDHATSVAERSDSIPIKMKTKVSLAFIGNTKDSMKIYVLNPDSREELCLIYIHGGAYINQASPDHWRFLDTVAQTTGIKIIVPIYPLAPKHTFEEAYALVGELYNEVLKIYDSTNIIMAGDSAGGGLAIGLCEELGKKGIPRPSKLILMSPWVDVTMSNPTMQDYLKDDPLLCRELRMAGFAWAGEPHRELRDSIPSGSKVLDYRVSPIHGDVSCLPDTLLFAGTNEILFPDIMAFRDKIKEAGVKVECHVGEKMIHIWPLFGIKESAAAVTRMCDFISEYKMESASNTSQFLSHLASSIN